MKRPPARSMWSGDTENATHTAKNDETATPANRSHHGRSSTGAIASTASVNGRPPPECGSSKRSQSAAITKAATPESSTVLSTRCIRDRRALERRFEPIARSHDGNRNPSRIKAEQQGLRPPAGTVERRRVDVDERDLAPRERALHEPVHKVGLEAGRYDHQLERARNRAVVRREQPPGSRRARRFYCCQELERAPPVRS